MPGEITKELITNLKNRVTNIHNLDVTDVRIGLGYTGIMLNDRNAGVCHTLSRELACCQKVDRAGKIAGSSALKIAELANSWKLDEAIVGVATINALSQIVLERDAEKYLSAEDVDCIDQIRIRKDDTVALVGYIKPFISKIKSRAKDLFILERNLILEEEDVLPDTACEEILPEADIVVITGTAIVNGTIDRLLELSKNAREVCLVGPTASMIPDPLFKRGITIMGGIKITNAEKILRIISEGGGVPQFKGSCRQIVLRPKHQHL